MGIRAWVAPVILREVQRCLAAAPLSPQGRVLVACSGGRDSMVLAHAVLKSLGPKRLVLGHVDHAVRPSSGHDRDFVAAWAHHIGCGFIFERLEPGPADEARLRTARYAALERMRVTSSTEWILTAHTRDDQAETVLMALLRTGRPNTSGIRPKRERILRPLLAVGRSEVADYLQNKHLQHIEDATNFEPRYTRNRVRKELMPLLEHYRPGFARRLAGWADPRPAPNEPARPLPPAVRQQGRWLWRRQSWDGVWPSDQWSAVFDADRLDRFEIRCAQAGDVIQPLGMIGRKRVFEALAGAHVPASARPLWPVLTDGESQVLWVPGVIRGAAAAVGEATRQVWLFTLQTFDELQDGASRVSLGEGVEPAVAEEPTAREER